MADETKRTDVAVPYKITKQEHKVGAHKSYKPLQYDARQPLRSNRSVK